MREKNKKQKLVYAQFKNTNLSMLWEDFCKLTYALVNFNFSLLFLLEVLKKSSLKKVLGIMIHY